MWHGGAPSPELLLGGRAVQRVLQLRLQCLQLLPQVSLLLLGLVPRGPFRVQVLLQVRDVALQLPDLLQGVVLLSDFVVQPARDRAPELRPGGSGPLLSHDTAEDRFLDPAPRIPQTRAKGSLLGPGFGHDGWKGNSSSKAQWQDYAGQGFGRTALGNGRQQERKQNSWVRVRVRVRLPRVGDFECQAKTWSFPHKPARFFEQVHDPEDAARPGRERAG